MTEAEWLAATDPTPMLLQVAPGAGDRRSRLLRAAAARVVWNELPDGRLVDAVVVAERYADGLTTDTELTEHRDGLYRLMSGQRGLSLSMPLHLCVTSVYGPRLNPLSSVGHSWRLGVEYLNVRLPPVVRDIFGNPFRPVVADPRWLTPTVVALAAGIYADRAFDRLPVLADALMEAGCEDADILAHCRGDGPHVRGCWVVDLVLGKA